MRLVLLVAAAARSDTLLRETCPNANYAPYAQRTFGMFYDGNPEVGYTDLAAFHGRYLLEIGGPTPATAIYAHVAGADNVVERPLYEYFAAFSTSAQAPRSDADAVDGAPYAPEGSPIGRTFLRHGARLHGIADAAYDALLSSHNLEHFLDPLEALREWDRVLRPEGLLVLVLPQAFNCTDKHRTPASMQELLAIRAAAARGGLDPLRRHYHELFVRTFDDIDRDFDPWGLNVTADTDARRAIIRRETTDALGAARENVLHWHIWDWDLMEEAVAGCLGYEILSLWLQPPEPPSYCPYHQVLVARKPAL